MTDLESEHEPTENQLAILKELCTSNGLSVGQLECTGQCVTELEMFFSGYPVMIGLNFFPNLTTLVIIGQEINMIENLSQCPDLRELWICECKLKKLASLEYCKRLTKLHLYDNKIRKIENVDQLQYLDELDLSNNEIRLIEGLSYLKCLRVLNLAGNNLRTIGEGLNRLTRLEDLNLSGNYLASFKDLISLTKLPELLKLTLKDPLYHNNPVCLLCNYSTYILFHMPKLKRLDNLDITNAQLRNLAVMTVRKKKIYYNMRVKTIQRNLTTVKNRLLSETKAVRESPKLKIKELEFALKSLKQQFDHGDVFDDLYSTDSSTKKQQQMVDDEVELKLVKRKNEDLYNKKTDALKKRIVSWKKQLKDVEFYHDVTNKLLDSLSNVSLRRLVLELETGGNVRFEVGSTTDLWYTTCNDLVLSRFCAWDFKEFGISGMKLHGITRVHNRAVQTEFDSQVNDRICDETRMPNQKAYTKMIDYLFYVWTPHASGKTRNVEIILEKGFSENEMVDGYIPLTNSLYLSEKERLETELKRRANGHEPLDISFFRQARIIVAKVFLGKCSPVPPNAKLCLSKYSKMDSLCRSRKELSPRRGDECECSVRQAEYFVFKPCFVLPEYIIDMEYVFQAPVSPYQMRIGQWLNASVVYLSSGLDMEKSIKAVAAAMSASTAASYEIDRYFMEERKVDDEVMQLKPQINPRPRIVSLTDAVIFKLGRSHVFTKITKLNLHGNGLLRLRGVGHLTQLRELTVSFNELSRLDEIAHLGHLERVDAGFNRINSLEGMRGLNKLRVLDIDWNLLSNIRDDLTVLRKHAPVLSQLKLANNPWIKPDDLFKRVIGKLKTIEVLDGRYVDESDQIAANKLISVTRLSSSILANHSRTDRKIPNTLRLYSNAQVLTEISNLKPNPKETTWMTTVTVLNLNNQYVSKVGGVESLKNLKWASFNSNCITKLEGIDTCTCLEELYLNDNCIMKLEGLSKLTKLQKLELSGNYISSIENCGFEKLKNLILLSIENNKIGSFKGLAETPMLVEFYAGNNRINNLHEIFHLKTMATLFIVDLYGNVIVQKDEYRLFTIYHLQSLKSLDGNVVDSSEEAAAREMLGGKLSADFVVERLNHSVFSDIRELDFPSSSIRTVDISADLFKNLQSVNLERNNLTSFSGLIELPQLKVLCLNHNQIEGITPRTKNSKPQIRSQYAIISEPENKEKLQPVLESLEVLHLGYNKINHLSHLQLGRLVNLKALFLQGNEISKLDGLDGLYQLKELVLDRNKVKVIHEKSFLSLYNLQELHLEENRIVDLTNLSPLANLQRLFLGMNRVQEMSELEKLDRFPKLVEISVIGNAVARRLLHRPLLVFQQPNLQIIDGFAVTHEERVKAEHYFFDQQSMLSDPGSLPGISPSRNRASLLKITNMPVGNQQITSLFPASSTQYYEDDRGVRRLRDRGGNVKGNGSTSFYNNNNKLPQNSHGAANSTTFGKPLNYNNNNNGRSRYGL